MQLQCLRPVACRECILVQTRERDRRRLDRAARRARHRAQDPDAQQALLPSQSLADLDLRVLHRAGPADLRSVRPRLRRADGRRGWQSCWSAPASPGLRASCRAANRRRTSSASPRIGRTRSIGASATRLAWGEIVAFAVLNIVGLIGAVVTGDWHMQQIYDYGYFPIAGTVWLLGALGQLPRVKAVDRRRGPRAPLLLRLGVGGPDRAADAAGLCGSCCRADSTYDVDQARRLRRRFSCVVGWCARLGLLPRTRPIVPGRAGGLRLNAFHGLRGQATRWLSRLSAESASCSDPRHAPSRCRPRRLAVPHQLQHLAPADRAA